MTSRDLVPRQPTQYAMKPAGHTSSPYIWRYVQPSSEEKEAALEELF